MSVASIVNFEYILHFTGYKLTYHDSGKTIQFLFLTMQFFPSTQKIMIPSYQETKAKHFLAVTMKKQFHYAYVIFYENSLRFCCTCT